MALLKVREGAVRGSGVRAMHQGADAELVRLLARRLGRYELGQLAALSPSNLYNTVRGALLALSTDVTPPQCDDGEGTRSIKKSKRAKKMIATRLRPTAKTNR